jgi:hypothetical protein
MEHPTKIGDLGVIPFQGKLHMETLHDLTNVCLSTENGG